MPSTSRRHRSLRRTYPQRLLLVVNVLLAAALVAGGLGLSYVRSKASEIAVVRLGYSLAPSVDSSEPRNVLLVGTDFAGRLPEGDPRNEDRDANLLADTIMILRLDPAAQTAKLVSFPRDSWVPTAPNGRRAKINSSIYGPAGPDNLISTIKSNFGVSIDNFVSVDFRGFIDLVDVLGGVPVYVRVPVRDEKTGLDIAEVGCVELNPDQALAYARSRDMDYFYDGEWHHDGSVDLGRIARQQDFLRHAANTAVRKGARNPATAAGLVNAAIRSVTKDEALTAGQVLDLVSAFRTYNPDAVETYAMPTTSDKRGRADVEIVDWPDAESVLEVLRSGTPGKLVPRDTVVGVDGASPTMTNEKLRSALATAGFDTDPGVDQRDNEDTHDQTVISYGPRGREAALLVARSLDAAPEFDYDESLPGRRVVIEVGNDLVGVRPQPGELPPGAPLEPTEAELEPLEAPELSSPVSSTPEPGSAVDGAETGSDSSAVDSSTTIGDEEAGATEEPTGGQAPPPTSPSGGVLPIDPTRSQTCAFG